MKPTTLNDWADLSIRNPREVAVTGADLGFVNRSDARWEGRASARPQFLPPAPPTILVGVDFLPASLRAAEQAFAWAKQWHASILLLHVVDSIYTGGLVNLVTKQNVRREAQHRALARVKKLADAHTAEGLSVTCVVRDGLPEVEILQLAEQMKVSMIVLGRRSKNLLGRWILGSVSETIVDLAACPVVLVNPAASVRSMARVGAKAEETICRPARLTS